ncbi:MAG: flagellar M-ring protein FliF [Deltaproteobacteria bacterium]|nr:flagellar M-ring protein FliF [Deltaproteobacteria bacterium]
MASIGENFIQVIKAIPPGKKISFIVTLCVVLGGFAALIFWTNRPNYQILFANLEAGDAARITEQLQEKRIPYQLESGGSAILVPDEMVYQLRLDLASEGIPRGNSVGFEIFDKMSFGTTEFVQRLKYQQALQGELARTIMGFDAIDKVRVHIVTADDSLFARPEKPATASVVIRTYPGRTLEQKQLLGIINLVACAVEGLKPENVTVVDMAGGMLAKGNDENTVGSMNKAQFEYQQKIESLFEKRIQTMLEPVVGVNKVVARVTADVDFRQVNVSEEKFDPDSAVIRSEQRQKESSTDAMNRASGSPDLKFEVYQTEGGAGSGSKNYEKENAVINYEINKINTQIINSAGEIKRLSAAVIIDGPYELKEDAQGNMVQTFVPRSRKEIATFTDIIKKAMGFDEERGDQVNVSNIAFSLQEEAELFVEPQTGFLDYIKKSGKMLFNIALVILFFLFAIRPFKRWLNHAGDYVNTMSLQQGAEIARLEDQASDEIRRKQENKRQLLEATKENPDAAAEIIRRWINEVS